MGNLLEGLYYEMVLAPFYQDFMKSLDEHINELVEGIVLPIIFEEKQVIFNQLDLSRKVWQVTRKK